MRSPTCCRAPPTFGRPPKVGSIDALSRRYGGDFATGVRSQDNCGDARGVPSRCAHHDSVPQVVPFGVPRLTHRGSAIGGGRALICARDLVGTRGPSSVRAQTHPLQPHPLRVCIAGEKSLRRSTRDVARMDASVAIRHRRTRRHGNETQWSELCTSRCAWLYLNPKSHLTEQCTPKQRVDDADHLESV
jgi:hypothetical protein